MIDPLWATIPAGAGALGLGAFSWNRYLRRKAAKEKILPLGASILAADNLIWKVKRIRSKGRLTLILVGTYGVREGLRIIDAFQRAGCLDDIGVVIAIELDERERAAFLGSLPFELAARTVFCSSSLLPGGLQNATIEEAESPFLRQYWQPPVLATLEEACRLIRGTEQTVYDPANPLEQQGYDPAVILVIASPGGHTALGVYASRRIQAEFPLAHTYVITALPDDGHLRKEFPEGVVRYQQEGFVRWFMVTDNRRNVLANDYAVAVFLGSIWVAPLLADMADEPWNILVRLYPRGFGGVVVPRLWWRMIPVHHTRANPPQFFTFEEAVIRAVLDGIAAIEHEQTKAILLSTPAPNTSRYVVVTVPLVPQFLIQVKDKVEEALRAKGWFAADGSRHLVWATLAEPMSSKTTSVRMSIAMMETAVNGLEDLEDLAQGALLTPPQPSALPGLDNQASASIPATSPQPAEDKQEVS